MNICRAAGLRKPSVWRFHSCAFRESAYWVVPTFAKSEPTRMTHKRPCGRAATRVRFGSNTALASRLLAQRYPVFQRHRRTLINLSRRLGLC
jgi:hypothetical protein